MTETVEVYMIYGAFKQYLKGTRVIAWSSNEGFYEPTIKLNIPINYIKEHCLRDDGDFKEFPNICFDVEWTV